MHKVPKFIRIQDTLIRVGDITEVTLSSNSRYIHIQGRRATLLHSFDFDEDITEAELQFKQVSTELVG